jgi:hypothetical protein
VIDPRPHAANKRAGVTLNGMDRMALGDYEAFRAWSGKPRAWGPEGSRWRAWFGGKVIDGLCEVLDEHLAAKRRGRPAAIGCVPWLDSQPVVDRLLGLTAFCVVVDKGTSFPGRLLNREKGFPNIALLRLRDMAPSDNGSAPVLGPWSHMPEHELGPVRVLGWHHPGRKPLLHAKLLVLGHLAINAYGPDEDCCIEELDFEPRAVWWGSANWTRRSQSHLEVGFVCDDQALVEEATEFVASVIAFSEPVQSTCAGPEPDLVRVEFDDAAMAEAAAEMEQDPDDEQ